MAKNGNGGKKSLFGPLYTAPGKSLGPTSPSGPSGGKTPPDPIGLTHGLFGKGPSGKSGGTQKHDKS